MYLQLGTLAAMSLVHGGAGFRIFCPTVYRFLNGKTAADLIASSSEVPDPGVGEFLKQVRMYTEVLEKVEDTKDAQQLRQIAVFMHTLCCVWTHSICIPHVHNHSHARGSCLLL